MANDGLFDDEGFENELTREDPLYESSESDFFRVGVGNGPATPSTTAPLTVEDDYELGRPAGGRPHRPHHGHRPNRPAFVRAEQAPTVVVQTTATPPVETVSRSNRKVRTRPMPPRLRQRWPDVATMLVTNRDGSQILFIA